MNRLTKAILVPLVMLAATATAQQSAVVFRMPDGKTMIVMVLGPQGPQVITNVQLIELAPPSPPQPSVLATSAMVLLETEEQGIELANLKIKLAEDEWLQGKLLVLDKDAKNQDNQPSPRVQAALRFLSGKHLPQLVAFTRDGNPVAAEALPATVPLVVDQMQKWGIK